jgi:hypothetical protein
VIAGERPPVPETCPKKYNKLMTHCWVRRRTLGGHRLPLPPLPPSSLSQTFLKPLLPPPSSLLPPLPSSLSQIFLKPLLPLMNLHKPPPLPQGFPTLLASSFSLSSCLPKTYLLAGTKTRGPPKNGCCLKLDM